MINFIKKLLIKLLIKDITCLHSYEYFDNGTTCHCVKCNSWEIKGWNGHWIEVNEKFINKVLRGIR